MDLLYFVLCSYGLTMILVFGSIFNKIRPNKDWLRGTGKIFHCPMCMGFWVGVFLFSINPFTELFTFDYNLINAFLLGCLSSGTSYLLSMIVNDFGFKINQKE
jgi:hypothetical protein|tara:strand:+ start:142 stop:450 length:309 start_codon:yes stop_codon:yes gene_type:complete